MAHRIVLLGDYTTAGQWGSVAEDVPSSTADVQINLPKL